MAPKNGVFRTDWLGRSFGRIYRSYAVRSPPAPSKGQLQS